jgi:hypothetical protein
LLRLTCGDRVDYGRYGKLLVHDSETVRKKTIIALQTFHQLAPDVVTSEELNEKVRKVLCDRGVTGLAMIVETHPQYAAQHQMSVMVDCLEDADETLQRKTLDLLYRMTNPVNVEFITDILLDFLRGTSTDQFLKQQLTRRICSVAERYAPNNAWYIQTITQLFELDKLWGYDRPIA